MRRRAPRPLRPAVAELVDRLAPPTPLAALQRIWPEVVGERIAQEAELVATRDGALTVVCRSSVWAQELDLMGPEIVRRLGERLPQAGVRALRCRTASTPAGRRPPSSR